MYTDYLNIAQLSGALNLPRAYLKRLADAGEIPFIMAGKNRRRFSEKDARAALTRIADRVTPRRRKTTLGINHGL